jgi:hypothetical protein
MQVSSGYIAYCASRASDGTVILCTSHLFYICSLAKWWVATEIHSPPYLERNPDAASRLAQLPTGAVSGLEATSEFWKYFVMNWYRAVRIRWKFRPDAIVTTGKHNNPSYSGQGDAPLSRFQESSLVIKAPLSERRNLI